MKTLRDIAVDLKALGDLAHNLATEVLEVVTSVGDFSKVVRLLGITIKELPTLPETYQPGVSVLEELGQIHNSMKSGGVPRRTSRRLSRTEKQAIRAEYEASDLKNLSQRESLAKKYHCTLRQVSSLVLNYHARMARFEKQKQPESKVEG